MAHGAGRGAGAKWDKELLLFSSSYCWSHWDLNKDQCPAQSGAHTSTTLPALRTPLWPQAYTLAFHLCVTPAGHKEHPRHLQGFHLPHWHALNMFGNLAFNLPVLQFLLLFASSLPGAEWMQPLHSSCCPLSSVLTAGQDPHCHLGTPLFWIRKTKSPIISASTCQYCLSCWIP